MNIYANQMHFPGIVETNVTKRTWAAAGTGSWCNAEGHNFFKPAWKDSNLLQSSLKRGVRGGSRVQDVQAPHDLHIEFRYLLGSASDIGGQVSIDEPCPNLLKSLVLSHFVIYDVSNDPDF